MASTLGFYSVKIAAIFILSVVYFLVGSVLSVELNRIIPDENLHELSTPYLVLLLSAIFGGIGVLYYLLRITIKRMPFFLDGLYGFQYARLQEASGGLIIAYTMYAYLKKLEGLMREMGRRLRPTPSVSYEKYPTDGTSPPTNWGTQD
jgi:hypothetical protein